MSPQDVPTASFLKELMRRRKRLPSQLAAIKSFFNYLVESDGLEVNPAASIRSPRIPVKEPEYLTDEESIYLLTTIAREAKPQVRERDMAMVVLFLHTGLRVSELTNLELVNVDLERGQIKVTRKGNKEQSLHLNGETVNMLARYLANRPEAENGTFFTGTNGDNLDRRYIYGIVRRYLELAGIVKGKRGPHILRHTFCTRLHQKGVGPFTIKDLAGHKSLNTTMRYIKIENKEQAEAIDRLEFGISFQREGAKPLLNTEVWIPFKGPASGLKIDSRACCEVSVSLRPFSRFFLLLGDIPHPILFSLSLNILRRRLINPPMRLRLKYSANETLNFSLTRRSTVSIEQFS